MILPARPPREGILTSMPSITLSHRKRRRLWFPSAINTLPGTIHLSISIPSSTRQIVRRML